tara:strand:- start:637 stop:972 length:336 start_codon:yes stop_codon:yes gene_type:complete
MSDPQIIWNNKHDSIKLIKTNGKELILNNLDFIQFNRDIDDKKIKTKAQIIGFTFSETSPPKEILFYPYRDEQKRWATPIIMGKQRKIYNNDLDSIEIINVIPGSIYSKNI